jgi:hypothetical protein
VPEPGGRPLVLTILLITLLIHVPLMSARFRGSAPSMRAKLCLAKWLHEPQNILER